MAEFIIIPLIWDKPLKMGSQIFCFKVANKEWSCWVTILFYVLSNHFTTPPAMCRGSSFPASSAMLVVVCLFGYGRLCGFKVVSHYGFDSYFPNGQWCWASFHVFIGHLYIFFWEMSINICPFKNWGHLFFYGWVVRLLKKYVVDISVAWLENIFSNSVGSFHFLEGGIRAIFKDFDDVDLSILFGICAFDVISRKLLPDTQS